MDTRSSESALLIRFAGNKKGVDWQTSQALAELRQYEVRNHVLRKDQELWRQLAEAPVSSSNGFRISVLPDRTSNVIESLAAIDPDAFHTSHWQFGVADGRFRMIDRFDRLESLTEIQQAVSSLGGKLILDRRIQTGHEEEESARLRLIRRIKDQLDPNHTFLV